MTASESARAFAALSASEKSQKITIASEFLEENGAYYVQGSLPDFPADLLKTGYFDEFLKLPSGQASSVWSMWDEGIDPNLSFLLVSLNKKMIPDIFELPSNYGWGNFEESYNSAFARSPHGHYGSEPFRQSLYQYFEKYGQKGKDYSTSQCDPYLVFAAFALKDTHGEEKVITIIERIIAETPVAVSDFIALVQSDFDYSELPLSWAIKLVGSDPHA